MPLTTRLSDLDADLLAVAAASMDPADLPARRFVSGGPTWARDLGCNLLVVHPGTLSSANLTGRNQQTVAQPQHRVAVRVGIWVVTLVTDCHPAAQRVGQSIVLPTPAELTAAAANHRDNAWDIWRGVSRACIDGTIFDGACQNVVVGDLTWAGPIGLELGASFTVTADLV